MISSLKNMSVASALLCTTFAFAQESLEQETIPETPIVAEAAMEPVETLEPETPPELESPPEPEPVAIEQPEPPPAEQPMEPVEPVAPLAPVVTEQVSPTPKVAAEHPWHKGLEFGFGAGVPGISLHLGYRFPRSNSFFKNRIGFRLHYSTVSPIWEMAFKDPVNDAGQDIIDGDIDIEGLTISDAIFKADVSSFHLGALVDFHPFGYIWGLGGFRLSAGYYFGSSGVEAKISDYKIALEQKFASEVELEHDNTVIPVDIYISGSLDDMESLKMGMKFNTQGPYTGVGWDFGLFAGLHLTFDAGVVFTKAHYVTLSIPKIQLPSNAKVEFGLDKLIENDLQYGTDQLGDFLDQLRDEGYCDAPNTFACDDARNDKMVTIPQHLVDQFKDEYSEVIDDLNDNIQKGKNKALSAKKSNGDESDGINTMLKKVPYFPIIRLGFMWRF
ncbi:MAG: hypothetical protein LBU89_08205 [Fibromonadaceae bacterium]|jgi:hypothetical protein|nr:hypothetical protein [Fibromonadaceae bacterium]